MGVSRVIFFAHGPLSSVIKVLRFAVFVEGRCGGVYYFY